MSVSVIYSTEAFLHKTNGHAGRQSEPVLCDSLEKAKAEQLPVGYAFASIQVVDGFHTYSKPFGWELHSKS
jgi:hypothetical protein